MPGSKWYRYIYELFFLGVSSSPPNCNLVVESCDEAARVGLLDTIGTSPSKSSLRLDSSCTRGVLPGVIPTPPGVRFQACCAGLGEMLRKAENSNPAVPGVMGWKLAQTAPGVDIMDEGSCVVFASGVEGKVTLLACTAGEGDCARNSSRSAPSLPASIESCVRRCDGRDGEGVRGGEDLKCGIGTAERFGGAGARKMGRGRS